MDQNYFFSVKLRLDLKLLFFPAIYCNSHEKNHQSAANSVFFGIISRQLSVWKHGIANVLLYPVSYHL